MFGLTAKDAIRMDKPLVCPIVATSNRADIVGEAIESILGQTYKNCEVLVADNELTDGTHETLRWFSNRIRVMRQENAEPGTARNRGIVVASGKVIAFQD
jgi:glycosyltransferase involved in cell wall biosynthesis